MATLTDTAAKRLSPLAPDTYEKVLSAGAVILGVAVAVALIRGRAQWGEVPPFVWLHLVAVALAVALTPIMMLSRRGTPRHRALGRVWVAAMLATAAFSFGIRERGDGSLSVIHILSAWTLIQVPVIWYTARTHRVARHRSAVRGMVTGALLVAGFFTFPFDRLLGRWLFG